MKNIILFIIALVVLAGVWLYIRKPANVAVVNNVLPGQTTNTDTSPVTPVGTGTNANNAVVTDSSIVVDSPKANATTASPISLTGRARGNWFSEAVAPVTVVDSTGKKIGQGQIRATGDWMTTDYVPFTGSVVYTLPSGASTEGYVLFMNDNPSGDPVRNVSVRVPVHFKR